MLQELAEYSMPALAQFIFLFNAFHVVVAAVQGPVCLDCRRLENPYACNKIRQCPSGYKCFSTYYWEPQSGGLYWDQGCKTDSFCTALPSQRTQALSAADHILAKVQQTRNSFKAKRLVDSNDDPLRLCMTCCRDHSDFCNLLPCDYTLEPGQIPTGLSCLSCTDVLDPANCSDIVRCAPNEKCGVWTQPNGMLGMGCKGDATCQAEGNHVSFGKRDVVARDGETGFSISMDPPSLEGSRNRVSVRSAECRACCDSDFCNSMYCSLVNELPAGVPTVATTTIATTTPSTTSTTTTTTTTTTTPTTTTATTTTTTPTTTTTITTTPTTVATTPKIDLPTAMLQPKQLSTPSGPRATFNCRVGGTPPILVLFTIIDAQDKNEALPCATSISTNQEDVICEIDTSQVQPGTYKIECLAANNGASTPDFSILEVKVPTVPLSVDIHPSDTIVLPNALTSIFCRVNGSPIVSYNWIDSSTGQDIGNNSDFRTYITGNNTAVLEITPQAPNIQSVFVCQAFNALDSTYLPFEVRSFINLTVVNRPQDLTLTYGSGLPKNVSCDFESWPQANVSWFFETESNSRIPVNKSQINTIHQGTNVSSSVSITPEFVKQMSIASISCEADNGYSTISRSADIELQIAAKILTPAKSSVVQRGSSFSLVCEAEGSPEPQMAWTFTDEFGINKILIGADVQKIGATQTLNIDHITDSGTFTCYAKNPLATVTVAFDVQVV